MESFQNKPSRPPETLTPSKIEFLGEQDGPPERDLKEQLAAIPARHKAVWCANLARADYGDGTGVNVVLCVRSTGGKENLTLCDKIGDAFAAIFGSHEHLEILFILDDQEQELSRACRPFYVAG